MACRLPWGAGRGKIFVRGWSLVSGPRVGIVLGSDRDYELMEEACTVLREFEVPFEVTVASAHRTPEKAAAYAREAEGRGLEVLIAGAGLAAHLPGFLAAHTSLPVIGVPLARGTLGGMDALLSIAQMPPGVPVAAVGVNGARNAALLAVEMLALKDAGLRARLKKHREELAREVGAREERLKERLSSLPKSW